MATELHRPVSGRRPGPWIVCLCLVFLGPGITSCRPFGEAKPSTPEASAPGERPDRPRIESFDLPSGPDALAPRLTATEDGLLLTWLEPVATEVAGEADRHRLRISRLGEAGEAWSDPVTIHEGPDFFANWADVPGVAREPEGALVAWWLQMLGEGTYAYGVRLARSLDRGESWEEVGWLHDDTSPTEHGFVSWVAEGEGLRAFWLDGRSMSVGPDHRVRGAMALRTATVVDGQAGPSAVVDSRTCECCDTDAARAAGAPLVVYRDRTPSEIRDVAIAGTTGEGGWEEPRLVHPDGWEIAGCPVNGPAVTARDRRVAVAWFTAAENASRVLAAFSGDGGERFGDPVLLDGDRPVGRVGTVFGPAGDLRVSWLGRTEEGGELRLARVGEAGIAEPVLSVAETSTGRSAGVPTLARHGESLWLVWIEEPFGEPARLRGARIR